MTDFSVPALGLSGQGNSGLPPAYTATNTEENYHSAVTPNFVADLTTADKIWFPMRIAYGRTERTVAIKNFLDEIKVENFLPMRYDRRMVDGFRKLVRVPALDGLIFIRSSQPDLTYIKRYNEMLLPLRYMMWSPRHDDEQSRIITIPQRAMANFMRVASVEDDRVMYLANQDFSHKIGRRVRVLEGPFEGVEGTIYRVKKDRRVVVTLDHVCSVAIAYINPSCLREIEE